MRPTLRTRYRVPRRVLVDTRELLLPSAREQMEGTVVWRGRMISDHVAEISAAHRPRQRAYRSQYGLSVEVPPLAISEMIDALPPGELVLVRVHTHGTAAYHSRMDDRNMLIAHEGAISIVIPHFAREPIDLRRCSVNELRREQGWVELSVGETARRFEVFDG